MRTAILAVFLALLGAEALGTGVFLAMYLRSAGWRDTPVGRHLAAYSGALLGLYVVSFASFIIRDNLLMSLIVLGCHVAFAGVIWQRVVLLRRAQRKERSSEAVWRREE